MHADLGQSELLSLSCSDHSVGCVGLELGLDGQGRLIVEAIQAGVQRIGIMKNVH